MPSFRLTYWSHGGETPRSLVFEAADLEAAHDSGARKIAEAMGRANDFALLDPRAGRFTVGAAIWSRNGFYRLEAESSERPHSDRGVILDTRA